MPEIGDYFTGDDKRCKSDNALESFRTKDDDETNVKTYVECQKRRTLPIIAIIIVVILLLTIALAAYVGSDANIVENKWGSVGIVIGLGFVGIAIAVAWYLTIPIRKGTEMRDLINMFESFVDNIYLADSKEKRQTLFEDADRKNQAFAAFREKMEKTNQNQPSSPSGINVRIF